MTLLVDVVTLFPELISQPLSVGMAGRAQATQQLVLHTVPLRNFGIGPHHAVDDTPYGGGAGMVLRPEPVFDAVEWIAKERGRGHRILLTPSGTKLTQAHLRRWSTLPHLVFLCGRYEGFDERVSSFVEEEISLGDFVVTGGEWAALVIIDGVVRLLPGILNNPDSLGEESFEQGLLEYPHYTKPLVFQEQKVPDILLSGNHAHVRKWRRQQALFRTYLRRPDLLLPHSLSPEDKVLLEESLGKDFDEK